MGETIAGTLALSRSLPTLPFDLIVEILCRLSVKFLLQFRCVCKSWNYLIVSPKFIKKHLHLSTKHLVHTLTYSNLSHKYVLNSIFNDVTTEVAHLEYPSNHLDHFVGSCNGILCLADIYNELFRLWNPSIRKFKELPRLKKQQYSDKMMMYGFGHDPIIDNYKVVAVLHASDGRGNLIAKTYVKVYTSGTNIWTNIEEFPFGCVSVQQRSGKFVSGTINWLVSRMYPTKRQHFIASFDLRSESYQEVLLPDCGAVDVYNLRLGALGVLRGCLCMVFRHDVWVMKEYGSKESWTKLFAINVMQDLSTSYTSIKVLNIFEDNQVLLNSTRMTDKLIIYNSKNGTFKFMDFGNSAEVCVESLISPCS
ncbi:hypothetical protein TSUD_116400 [Trifolium subterraneum]|uniref:F-box domain-containing protein n=1 Tax=Trifolium subterraneum TaxID=3900 RepID=A0A2Z6LY75_TRISU|nr:hypothetical protein TSUD_116400 [Trifolium subterraneum]